MFSDEKMTTASVKRILEAGVYDVGIGEGRGREDKHHLTRSHQPEPHTSGRGGPRRLENKNRHLRDSQPEGERDLFLSGITFIP